LSDDKPKPAPDHGSTLVWSDDDEKGVRLLLKAANGNIDTALAKFFKAGGGPNVKTARKLAKRYCTPFGISEVEFMRKYRAWKRGNLH
jgi:hypothetical protein